MAKPATRIAAIQALMVIGALAVFGRSILVQVVQQSIWQERARKTRTVNVPIEAPRGALFDRNGEPLAVSQWRYRIRLTMANVKDTVRVRGLLLDAGIAPEKILSQFRRPYPYFSNLLSAEVVTPFRGVPGVSPDSELVRVYPYQRLALPWLGGLDDQGHATGGIESAFDTLLVGFPGAATYPVDSRGVPREVPGSRLRDPVPGHNIYLTIDHELQGIAEAELLDAVQTLPALGGDVVILDVHTGEILAIASLRRDELGRTAPTTSAVVEPMEPGSTAKIFTAAAVLRNGVETTPVPAHDGRWTVPGTTRAIVDVHAEHGFLTLGETIKVSSNVGISQFALRLQPEQQYLALRDFGFGTPSAVGFPAEASGVLFRPPWVNRNLSQPSLGQGYEMSVTALQMSLAYAAIANGGTLLVPSLVREVRAADGVRPIWKHQTTAVRQVVTPEIASQLRDFLRLATDSGGSGAKAQLDFFTVIGKTATAKMRPYTNGVYRAAFAGLFPGDDPQIVVYVMIDRPAGGEFYGGTVAAPLVRKMLQQALGSIESPLDRHRLEGVITGGQVAQLPRKPGGDSLRSVNLPLVARATHDSSSVTIPMLTGLSPREAVASLHRLGLRAMVVGVGAVLSCSPEIGSTVPRGTTITLTLAPVQ